MPDHISSNSLKSDVHACFTGPQIGIKESLAIHLRLPDPSNPNSATAPLTPEQRLEQLHQARIAYLRAYEACWRDAQASSIEDGTFVNGEVLADGTVISSRPINDGSYKVVSWDGQSKVNTAGVLTVSRGIGTPAGIVFAMKVDA